MFRMAASVTPAIGARKARPEIASPPIVSGGAAWVTPKVSAFVIVPRV
jgi:hypothetical protein